jgi:cephalosporin-C deacetylase-like acetyl esterase
MAPMTIPDGNSEKLGGIGTGFSPAFLVFYGFSGIGLEWELDLDVRMEGWMEYTMETHGYYNNWKATPKCHHVQ